MVCREQLDIPVFSMGDQVSPVEIAEKGIQQAIEDGRDVVIIDTAGRLHIDETLMNELEDVKAAVNPHEIFLVMQAEHESLIRYNYHFRHTNLSA